MLRDGLPYFVDYQGGRKGALQYDIASLLFDAKADLPPALRQQLLDHYLNALATFIDLDRDAFLRYYYAFVYVRIMQALGAYGYRGFFERKVHFLQSVPYALKNIRWLLHNAELPIELPTLLGAFQSMLASEKLQSIASEADNLIVRIFSFSFHHELPKDETGNGGGFAFDCEGPRHKVWLHPHALADRAVTNAEWLGFIADVFLGTAADTVRHEVEVPVLLIKAKY